MSEMNPNGWKTFNAATGHLRLLGVKSKEAVKQCKQNNEMKGFYQLAIASTNWTKFNSRYLRVTMPLDDGSVHFEGVLPAPLPGMFVGTKKDICREFTIKDETEFEMKGVGLVFRCDTERDYYMFVIRLVGTNVNMQNAMKLVDLILKTNGPIVLRPPAKRVRISKSERNGGVMPADNEPMGGAGGNETEDDEEYETREEGALALQTAIAKAQADQAEAKTAVNEVTVIRAAADAARAVVEANEKKTKETAEKAASTHALAEKAKKAATDAITKALHADRHARDASKALEESKTEAQATAEQLAAAEAAATQALAKSRASEADVQVKIDQINQAALAKVQAQQAVLPAPVIAAPGLDALAAVADLVASAAPIPAPAPAPPAPAVKPEEVVIDLCGDD